MPICCICEDGFLAGGGDRREKEVEAFLDNQNTVANLWRDWVRLEGGGSPALSGLGGKAHGSGASGTASLESQTLIPGQ